MRHPYWNLPNYLFNKDIHRLSNRAFLCLFVSFLFFCFMFLVGSKKKNVDMYFKNKIVFFQSCLSLLKFFSCEVCLTRTILINNCCLLIKISEHPHIVLPCPEICLLVTMLPSTLSIALAPMRAFMCAEWHSILESYEGYWLYCFSKKWSNFFESPIKS